MNRAGEGGEVLKETRRRGRPSLAEQLGRSRTGSEGSILDTFKRETGGRGGAGEVKGRKGNRGRISKSEENREVASDEEN